MNSMHFRHILLTAIVVLMMSAPVAAQNNDSEGPAIYPNLAADLLSLDVPVIDVRSDEEVEATGTLADAEHIVHTDVDAIAEFIGEGTDSAVVLYCGSGRRAGMVIDTLRERGYGGLVNAGGYANLQQAIEGGGDEDRGDDEDGDDGDDSDG